MQKEAWMQPALQASEAVLLPALERRTAAARPGNRYLPPPNDSAFRPADSSWETPAPTRVSVQRRGSMAGRSVLRAAGVNATPVRGRMRHGCCSRHGRC